MSVFSLIAGIASIVGLYFSIRAFLAAKAASEAAREAQRGILTRTVAEELELACNNADQLLDLVENDRLAEARLRAHELTSVLSEIPHRRGPFLDGKRSDELLTQREQFQIIEEVLSKQKSEPITPNRHQFLLKACRRSSNTMREILGKVKQTLDVGGKA